MTVKLIAHPEDDAFFRTSKSGTVWGTIYFQVGDHEFFPGKGWTDMVAAFAAVWLEAILRIASGTTVKERVRFFEGPLKVEISVNGWGSVQLDFFDVDSVKFSTTTEMHHLLENALTVANLVLQSCRAKGWENGDTEALEALIADGPQVLAKLRPH